MSKIKNTVIACVYGIPGAGKTYLINSLLNYFNTCTNLEAKIVLEPVEKFERFFHNGRFYLPFKEFSINPKRAALAIQMHILCTVSYELRSALIDAQNFDIILLDRDLTSCKIFSHLLFNKGYLNDFELASLEHAIDKLILELPETDLNIFLDTPVEICSQRIQARSRLGEQDFTTTQYLSDLRKCHIQFSNEATHTANSESDVLKIIMEKILSKGKSTH